MNGKRIALALAILVAVCAGQKPQAHEQKSSPYAALLARVQGGDLSIDFKRLRFSYMDSPERHRAKDTSGEQKDMWVSLNAKDYKKAAEKADIVLANQFVNLEAHFVEYLAYRELQNGAQSDFHHSVFDGLLKSITDSGDGQSIDTAYVVISTDEEYTLLRLRGLRPKSQDLVQERGHSYDVLEAVDPDTEKTVQLYFNVDIPMKHYLD